MNCNSINPVLVQDECKGCFTKVKCVTVDNDLTYLDIIGDTDLYEFIDKLISKIEELENKINILTLNSI